MPRAAATLSALFGDCVTTAVPPPDRAVRITGVVIAEAATAAPLSGGALVLGIGLDEAGTADLLARAGRARCAAVVVRDPGPPAATALADVARGAGVGLLLLKPAATWGELLPLAAGVLQQGEEEPDDAVPLGDLFALADAIADQVGGPVTLEDADFRVLAYSRFVGAMDPGRTTAILTRRMPDEWEKHLERTGALERLRGTGEVVDVTGGPDNANRRLIVAVRERDGRPLGFIWVAEAAGPLPDSAVETLQRTVPIAVPHYRRHRELRTAQHRHRQQLVRALLQGQGSLQRHADELDLPRNQPLVVLAVTATTEHDLPVRSWERIVDHVALCCEARRWTAEITRIGRTVLVITALPRGAQPDALARLGHDIVDRSATAAGQLLCAATSSLSTSASALPERRAEAEQALAFCRTDGSRRFVEYDQVRAHVIVEEATAVLRKRAELRLPGLQRLCAEDARRGNGQLVPTLRAYLDADGGVPATAARLALHPTTVRYRLGRIATLSGLDLDDPTTRLACSLLLRAAGDVRPPG